MWTHPTRECEGQVLILKVLEVDLGEVGVGGDGVVSRLEPGVLHVVVQARAPVPVRGGYDSTIVLSVFTSHRHGFESGFTH